MRTNVLIRVGYLAILILLASISFGAVSCNKTAEDTNKPVIIQSFTLFVDGVQTTPSGTLQIEPGAVLNIQVTYVDPDAGENPDPSWYSFTWVVERLNSGVSPFNPNENFISMNENPCIWTAPTVVGFYRFMVEVRDRYGTPAQESVVIEVNANKKPIINELSISENQPFVNEEVIITVDASDPDGNLPLIYDWQATGGYYTYESDGEAHWLSPASGDFDLTIIITDQVNGSVSRTIPVVVQANHDPIIEGWDLDPSASVKFNDLVTITLTATDEDGDTLEYNWQASTGTFNSVNEHLAVWRAPSEVIAATITCMVEDNKGGSDSVDIIINVTEE